MAEKKKKKFAEKIQDRYHLKIFNDTTFEEVWSFPLTRLNLFAYIGFAIILLIALVTVIIAFTPVREFIPGYPDGNMRKNIIFNAITVDSLQNELRMKDQYFQNLKTILEGNTPKDYINTHDTDASYDDITFKRSVNDSIFRQQIEDDEQYNLTLFDKSYPTNDINRLFFYPPLKGMITNKFKISEHHFGVDIVSPPDEAISSTLDGTVIMASWTLKTGYVIQVQHENDLISVYKHNAELLKDVGTKVKAGEAIAIFGNSGELSSGPHLHFELWYKGEPVNPEKYITF